MLDNSKIRKEIMETAIKYGEKHKTDKSVIMTIAGAMNAQIDYDAFEKGGSGMCTVFEEIANEAELKGIEKGIEKGIQR